MKPILFNTDMVKAILAGKKTVTRRLVKPRFRPGEIGYQVITEKHSGKYVRIEYIDEYERETRYMSDPFRPGDILYVRETWQKYRFKRPTKAVPDDFKEIKYCYLADGELANSDGSPFKWRPSIHMPKEAARIFLRVTDVRVERLQEIDEVQAQREGCYAGPIIEGSDLWADARTAFPTVWDGTLKNNIDRETYGWEANPWVWVIEFERCEMPKEG